MNSTGRTIEFYKTGKNSLILAEIRPVQCFIDSTGGQIKSTKWMDADHWLELEDLIHTILCKYEERQKLDFRSRLESDPVVLNGIKWITIGYYFKKNVKDFCSYLVPRHDSIWPEKDCSSICDKGGSFKKLGRSGYRLVLAVAPLKTSLPNNKSLEESLYSALDLPLNQTNSISSYFQKSSKLSRSKSKTNCSTELQTHKRDLKKNDTADHDVKISSPFDTVSEEFHQSLSITECTGVKQVNSCNKLISQRRQPDEVNDFHKPTRLLNISEEDGASMESDLFPDLDKQRCVRVNSSCELMTQLDDINYVNYNSQNVSCASLYDDSQSQRHEDEPCLTETELDLVEADETFIPAVCSPYTYVGKLSKSKTNMQAKLDNLFGASETSLQHDSQPDDECSPTDKNAYNSPPYYKKEPINIKFDVNLPPSPLDSHPEVSFKNSHAKWSSRMSLFLDSATKEVNREEVCKAVDNDGSNKTAPTEDTPSSMTINRKPNLTIKIAKKPSQINGRRTRKRKIDVSVYKESAKELEMSKKLQDVVKLLSTKTEADLMFEGENPLEMSRLSNHSAVSIPENIDSSEPKATIKRKYQSKRQNHKSLHTTSNYNMNLEASSSASIFSDYQSSSKPSPQSKRRKKHLFKSPKEKKKIKQQSVTPTQTSLDQYLIKSSKSKSKETSFKSVCRSPESIANESINGMVFSSIHSSLEDLYNAFSESSVMSPGELENIEFINTVINYFQALTPDDIEKFYKRNVKHFLKLKNKKSHTTRSKKYYMMQRRDINAEIYILFIKNSTLNNIMEKWEKQYDAENTDAVGFFYLVVLPDLIHKIFLQIPAVENHQSFGDDELEDMLFSVALEMQRRKE